MIQPVCRRIDTQFLLLADQDPEIVAREFEILMNTHNQATVLRDDKMPIEPCSASDCITLGKRVRLIVATRSEGVTCTLQQKGLMKAVL